MRKEEHRDNPADAVPHDGIQVILAATSAAPDSDPDSVEAVEAATLAEVQPTGLLAFDSSA
jgi:hypothetical protein